MTLQLHTHLYFERAQTFEDMARRVSAIATELADQGCLITSVSHALDADDPNGRYQFIVAGSSSSPQHAP